MIVIAIRPFANFYIAVRRLPISCLSLRGDIVPAAARWIACFRGQASRALAPALPSASTAFRTAAAFCRTAATFRALAHHNFHRLIPHLAWIIPWLLHEAGDCKRQAASTMAVGQSPSSAVSKRPRQVRPFDGAAHVLMLGAKEPGGIRSPISGAADAPWLGHKAWSGIRRSRALSEARSVRNEMTLTALAAKQTDRRTDHQPGRGPPPCTEPNRILHLTACTLKRGKAWP